jgi:hypothetical protein
MRIMLKFFAAFIFFTLTFSNNANAWFFFLFRFPGMSTNNPNEKCVTTSAQTGSIINSDGNQYLVTSVQGLSSKCSNQQYPVLVTVEPAAKQYAQQIQEHKTSNVHFDFPDGWEKKELSNDLLSSGGILHLINRTLDSVLIIKTIPKSEINDIKTFVYSKKNSDNGVYSDVKSGEVTIANINGLNVWQFERTGKLDNVSYTFLNSLFESKDEIVWVSAFTSSNNYQNNKKHFQSILHSISGLTPVAQIPATPLSSLATKTKQSTQEDKLGSPDDPIKKLETLKSLLDKGLIDKDDYNKKKNSILNNF